MLRGTLYIVGAVLVLVAMMASIGWLLPKGHHVSRSATFKASPATVFAAISDVSRFPEWRPSVKSVEMLPDVDRKRMFKEVGKNDAITYRVEESVRDAKLVTRIVGESLSFGGTWTFELQPAGAGTTLTITEDGEVYNPIFRFLSWTVFSQTATMETYLADLERHLAR